MKKAVKMETIKISRHQWWRGKMTEKAGESALRMYNGKQCCLGFVCRHYGATVKDILGVAMPNGVGDNVTTQFASGSRSRACVVLLWSLVSFERSGGSFTLVWGGRQAAPGLTHKNRGRKYGVSKVDAWHEETYGR